MAKNYKTYLQKAFRGVVHDILKEVSEKGLEGDSHYFITFQTNRPDVKMPDFVRAKYPEEISIILQNQFSNLLVSQDCFSVDLTFGGVSSTLTIPYNALKVFADPSSQFMLSFDPECSEIKEDQKIKQDDDIIDLTRLRKKNL